jgi:hypothetical protein
LVLHNFNGHSQDVELAVGYKEGSAPKETKRAVSLAAGETRVLTLGEEFGGLRNSGVHWASLEASYEDRHNGVSMMLTSVSESGEHSIRSVMNWVNASVREGWLWRADANQNTLLGIYNADTEEAPVMLSLDYYSGGLRSSYEKPLVLPPRGSELVDIGQIVAEQQPDADGDVIPTNVTFGGYRAVKQSLRGNIPIITEALIYDRKGRDFLTIYNTGCCHSAVIFRTPSVNGAAGQSAQMLWEGYDVCLNKWVNINFQASFSAPDPSIATLTSTLGQLLLVGAGTTNSNTSLFYFRETFLGECNGLTEFNSCTVVVRPRVNSISPTQGRISANTSVTITGLGFGSNPTVSAGTGISVTVNSASDSQIQATFNVSSTAPGGNHQVTVTANGKPAKKAWPSRWMFRP